MTLKLLGAVLIVLACGGYGFSLAALHKKEEYYLHQIIRSVESMICELEYRMTPLPELCLMAGKEAKGLVREVLCSLAAELQQQVAPDASSCMEEILKRVGKLPSRTRNNLSMLGRSLGKFALSGQLIGLRSVSVMCKRDLDGLAVDRDSRLRSYRTLGICAGLALAILLL